ncbi:MAG: histone deacetylase superfamily protein [Acidimicrobiales bacterium]|nr:histone deacetylase superfamily protein [Acidimicrobiales bacterium]
MLTVFSPEHRRHRPAAELIEGVMAPAVEVPERAEQVLAAIRNRSIGAVVEPDDHGADSEAAIAAVHDERYTRFLAGAHDEWLASGRTGDALPYAWPTRHMRQVEPIAIDGRLSYYSFDAGTPITSGTWAAAEASARVALTAARLVLAGEAAAFGLCRPPGHHASNDLYGGYCFLNNAAVAAQAMRDGGAARVAVLDVDYHAGNGTQTIFYERADVLTCSIHADPRQEYPYFLGYADETGSGAGAGANVNLPLPWGTSWDVWATALGQACAEVASFRADALVVSLGLDTYRDDPISRFLLDTSNYLQVGAQIRSLDIPTVFVLEGGYDLATIGVNTTNVFVGFSEPS